MARKSALVLFLMMISTSSTTFASIPRAALLSYGYGNSELATSARSTEDAHTQNWSFDHDTLGQPIHAGIDGSGFNVDHHFDESGNVISSTTPSRRGTTTYDYDGRSFMTAEHLPATAQPNKYEPDANGVVAEELRQVYRRLHASALDRTLSKGRLY